MEKVKSIKNNMIMSIILTASNFIFPFIIYSYATRILLPAGTGRVEFVQSVLSYFVYIAALGIPGYGLRECAKVRDDKEKLSKLTQELLIVNIISTLISYILLGVVICFSSKLQEYKTLFVIMSSSILFQSLGMEWLYKALEKYTYITVRSIILKIVAVILTFILVKSPENIAAYGFVTIFATSASYVLNFINARKYIIIKRYSNYEIKRHLKPIFVFFMSTVIISIYGHFDSVMLGIMYNDDAVGIYGAALKLKNIVLSVSTAITSVLIPRMTVYYNAGQNEKYKELIEKSLRISVILVVPLVLYVMLNAEDVILLACGKAYLAAKTTIYILMMCTLVLSFTNLLGNQILIPKGDEKRYSMSVFIGMFINLGLNFILIPQYGVEGAAFATLITECWNVFWMKGGAKEEVSYIQKHLKLIPYIKAVLIGGIANVIISQFIGEMFLIIRLVITTIIFFGSFYIVLLISQEVTVWAMWKTVIRTIKSRKCK